MWSLTVFVSALKLNLVQHPSLNRLPTQLSNRLSKNLVEDLFEFEFELNNLLVS